MFANEVNMEEGLQVFCLCSSDNHVSRMKDDVFQLFTLNKLNKRTHPKAEHTVFI